MSEDNSHDNEIFIDADSGFANEKNSYENLILKQMMECVKVLSREMTGGQVMHKINQNGSTEKYIEDVRELVINHTDTLRMLLCTYIKDNNEKQINAIKAEIESYKDKMGETVLITPMGPRKIKDIKGVAVDNPMWKEFIHFKATKYREMFEILVNAYNEQKAYIRSLEEE
jgi:hypothetical protein